MSTQQDIIEQAIATGNSAHDPAAALVLWEQALALAPAGMSLQTMELHLHRVNCLVNLDRHREALGECKSLVRAHPEMLSEYSDLGQFALQLVVECCLSLGEVDDAYRYCQIAVQALKEEPECCHPLMMAATAQKKAYVARAVGEPEDCEEAIRLALQRLKSTREDAHREEPELLVQRHLMAAELLLCRAENRLAGHSAESAGDDLENALMLYEKAQVGDDRSARHAKALLLRVKMGEFS